ncbi:MAG: CRTAC1 family protein [Sandaracinaceae bacterium]
MNETLRITLALALLSCLATREARAQGFVDVSAALGTDAGGRPGVDAVGGGVSVIDLDGDGRLDIVLTMLEAPTVYHQRPDGTFTRRDDVLAPASPVEAGGHLPFDMDGDGDLDVLLLGRQADALLRNEGELVFTDVSATHLPDVERWSAAAAPADFDGDGDLDVYVTAYIETLEYPRHVCAPDMLLLNDGAGRFSDVAAEAGIASDGCGLAVVTHDYDLDGDVDVLVVNDFGMFVTPNRLLRNDGPSGARGVTFSERSVESGFASRLYGMGVAVGDLDADGRGDVVASSIGRPAMLLARGEDFVDRTHARGADVVFSSDGYQTTWGLAIEDFDRDGWADVVMSGGRVVASNFALNGAYQPNVVMRGGASGVELDPPGWGLRPRGSGRGLAVGDVDGDGDPDVAIGQTDGTVALHRNDFASVAPARIRLRASETAADAVGARVTGRCGGVSRSVARVGGGSFAGASDAELRLSFPPPCDAPGRAVALTVRWPSGYTQRVTTTTGAALTVREPDWLSLAPGRLTLRPTDSSGDPLSTGASVVIRRDGASPVSATSLPGGGFEASWPAGGGAARIDLEIEGQRWGAHPVTEPAAYGLRTVPQRPVAGAAARLVASARAGFPAGAAVSVRQGAEVTPLLDDGRGQHVGAIRFEDAGPRSLVLMVDGVDVDTVTVDVAGAFDPTRSFVRYQTLYQLGASFFVLRGVVRDVNGRRVDAPVSAFSLTVDGVARAPLTASSVDGAFDLGFNTSGVADGALIELSLDGARLGPSPRLRRLAAASDITRFVSPTRSTCAPAMETMRPDGQDVLHFLVFLRDEHGQLLPDLGTSPQLTGDLSPLPEPAVRFDSHYLQRVRAGTSAGEASMHVEWYGVPLGVSCEVTLEGALRDSPSSARGTLVARPSELDVAAPGEHAVLTWEPRSEDRRLLGSGVVGEVWQSRLGAWRSDVAYVGFGRYERLLGPDRYGGTDAITVTASGAVARAEVQIVGPPAPDSGVFLDGGVSTDSGAPAPRDAASHVDAWTPLDAGGEAPPPDAGGGCAIAPRAAPSPWILLAILALLARRRADHG